MSVFSSLRSSLASSQSLLLPVPDEPGLWRPTRRTHLLHLGVAVFLLIFAYLFTGLPHEPVPVGLTVLACIALPVFSAMPVAGMLLGIVATWAASSVEQDTGIVATLAVWGVIGILIARGHPRWIAYCFAYLVAVPVVWVSARQGQWVDGFIWIVLVGIPCVVLGELLRRQRDRAKENARDRRQALVRQRRLIASELHDTVARDLTYAVMTAEQLKFTHPEDDDLLRGLDAVIEPVRTAVGQLRRSLQNITAADNDDAVLLSSVTSPRPITSVLADARRVLEARGASLEVEGVELFESEGVLTPGTRQQVLRVVNELIDNATKYTSVDGRVRITVEINGRALECMVTNPIDVNPSKDVTLSSGIGLEGARRRVETLGGELVTNQGGGRWTAAFTVPVRGAWQNALKLG
ncbi:MAG: histidine kinase [Actinomyces succiniciruminis]|uniref:histidine kinase n=1 Tax=Actinomyces succiniciruminis TaxID=1522002 RepID=A0A1L7RM14_9ACTO|nr:histidine kinase [Actinomyces succiniciruminis]MBM6980134.1 histidine kinase [Actinomyces succiniciruminis]CED90103.1 ATPase/histidine kinase/DNA gyrase B/HSP90 domain protein [Actinomyces succiniciruminis]